jgi:hypothetical protein
MGCHKLINAMQISTAYSQTMANDNEFFYFKSPALLVISGSTMSGKSFMCSKIVLAREQIIKPTPKKVIWVYGIWQDELFEQLRAQVPDIVFCNGMSEFHNIQLDPDDNALVAIDDCLTSVSDSTDAVNLFTKTIHHKKLFVIYMVQSLYMKSKYNTLLQRQAGYIILFQNKRNGYEAKQLGKELGLTPTDVKYLYKDASKYLKRVYILFVCIPETPETKSMLIHFLPDQQPKFYYYISD